ncbi:hypothetical protein ACLKA7_008785 [Drosophila subpalustris]
MPTDAAEVAKVVVLFTIFAAALTKLFMTGWLPNVNSLDNPATVTTTLQLACVKPIDIANIGQDTFNYNFNMVDTVQIRSQVRNEDETS